MYNFLTKNGQVIAFVVGAAITLIFYLMVFGGLQEGFNQLPKETQFETTVFNFGIIATVGLIIIAIAVTVFFSVFQIVTNMKGALKGIIAFGALIAVFLIAYSTGDGSVKEKWATELDVTEGISKFVSGAITTTLILIAVAVGAFLISEVRNFFK